MAGFKRCQKCDTNAAIQNYETNRHGIISNYCNECAYRYTCEYCDFKSMYKHNWWRHCENKHKYRCSECEVSSIDAENEAIHFRTHIKPDQKCPKCNEECWFDSVLRRHLLRCDELTRYRILKPILDEIHTLPIVM